MLEAAIALVAVLLGLVIGWVATHRLLAGSEETRRKVANAELETQLALARQEAAAIPDLKAQLAQRDAELRSAGGFSSRCEEQEKSIAALTAQIASIEESRARLQAELTSEKAALAATQAAREGAETAIETLRREKDAQLAERDLFITNLKDEIGAVLGKAAGEAVQKAQEDFVKISAEKANDDLTKRQKSIEEMVAPLKTQLKDLEELNRQIERDRAGQVVSVKEQVERLQDQTVKLENAFRKPQTRGAWGEQQLQILLEHAGLILDRDFTVQESTSEEEGRLRADFVVMLPHGRKLVIDCKAPLNAYMDAANAADELTRIERMKDHCKAIRGHIAELSSKRYQDRHPGADCVVMFIPHEGAYIHALEAEPALIDAGRNARVYIASPNSILGIVHLARYILAEQRARDGADELRSSCKELVDRVAVVASHVSALGTALSSAVGHYNKAVGSIDSRLMKTARDLSKHGIEGAKSLKTPDGVTDGARAFSAPELQKSLEAAPVLSLESATEDLEYVEQPALAP